MILSLSKHSEVEAWEQIRDIFFLSSVRTQFQDVEEKEAFYQRWTRFYFQQYPEQIFVFLQSGKVTAYLMGCDDSRSAAAALSREISSFSLFQDLFEKFPAHLHINAHPDVRGQGQGQKLIAHYFEKLISSGKSGLHIVTSPDAQNVHFYRKAGFGFECQREWQGRNYLFMGRSI